MGGGEGNRNEEQLELNACMIAPAPLLIRQTPAVVRKRRTFALLIGQKIFCNETLGYY